MQQERKYFRQLLFQDMFLRDKILIARHAYINNQLPVNSSQPRIVIFVGTKIHFFLNMPIN